MILSFEGPKMKEEEEEQELKKRVHILEHSLKYLKLGKYYFKKICKISAVETINLKKIFYYVLTNNYDKMNKTIAFLQTFVNH